MKRFTRQFIRPHTDVDFYSPRQAFLDQIQTVGIDSGLCTKFREASFLDDSELVIQYVSEWADSVDLEEIASHDWWTEETARELEYNAACEIVCISRSMEDV